jgi:deferrochelatase/peroxidase EfeB
MASQIEQVAYAAMRWNDAAKYSAKARELRDLSAWIETQIGTVDAALVIEADRIEVVAKTIRTQCESLAGWAEWKTANIDAMANLQDWFANGASE